jgi:hypothetical protein
MSNSYNPPTPTSSDSHGSPTSITSDPLAPKYPTTVANRSAGRNVLVYNNNDRTTLLGGLILIPGATNANFPGVTNANFYAMIRIFVEFTPRNYSHTFSLRNEGRTMIQEDNQTLQPGNYYIVTSGKFLYCPFMIK